MSDFDLSDLIPNQPPFGRESARARLRAEIRAERVRARNRRVAERLGVIGLAVMVMFGVTPAAPNPELAPLVGLADAVEASNTPNLSQHAVWYLRTEQRRLVTVPAQLITAYRADPYRFVLASVQEQWLMPGGSGGRRMVYANPDFMFPSDAGIFYASGLMYYYPVGRVTTHPFEEVVAPSIDWSASPQVVLAELVRHAPDQARVSPQSLLSAVADVMTASVDDPGKRSVLLRALAEVPGIEVGSQPGQIEVAVDYVEGQSQYEFRLCFDAENGQLTRHSVWVKATPGSPAYPVFERETVGSRWNTGDEPWFDLEDWSPQRRWGGDSSQEVADWEAPPWNWQNRVSSDG